MTGPGALEVVARSAVSADENVSPLPGFIVSDFPALLWTAARRCLESAARCGPERDEPVRTGIVLSSTAHDAPTLELAATQTEAGTLSPILFYQAVPTAVLGQIARDHSLTGPVSCLAAVDDPGYEAQDVALLTLLDGDADAMLLLTVDVAARFPSPRAAAELVRLADPTPAKESAA